jgi:Aspartyl protease
MRTKVLIGCLLCGALLCGDKGAAQESTDLKALYDAHQWFELRDALIGNSGPALYRGAVAAAFNRIAEAEEALKPLIQAGNDSEADHATPDQASQWLSYMYVRNGRYQEAAAAMDDNSAMANMLASLPDQSVSKFEPCTIPCRMHQKKLFIPGSIAGKTVEFFIDSDANFSFVSESEARNLGLSIRDSDARVYGAAGRETKFRISVADKLSVGNIDFKNVAFVVLPDTEEAFRRLPAGKQASLGLPVLLAFRSLRFHPESGDFDIGFPSQAVNEGGATICFDGVNPVAVMDFQQQHLPVVLDTGAAVTEIWPLFAKRFGGIVNAGKASLEVEKAIGGKAKVSAKVIPELKLRVGGFDAVLRPARVLLSQTTPDSEWYYGRLGLDTLRLARRVTIDFGALTLTLQ